MIHMIYHRTNQTKKHGNKLTSETMREQQKKTDPSRRRRNLKCRQGAKNKETDQKHGEERDIRTRMVMIVECIYAPILQIHVVGCRQINRKHLQYIGAAVKAANSTPA